MEGPVLALISAEAEWEPVRQILTQSTAESSPMGEYLSLRVANTDVVFFHGGWGKIASAASAQYAIDRWKPSLLVNLGTCGGIQGRIEVGTTILVERTLVYDIQEKMGDQTQAILHYETQLDLSWLPECFLKKIRKDPNLKTGLLVSADRDLLPADIPNLVETFGASAADWESASIAWVAQKNNTRCLILRVVSDLVAPAGGEVYGDIHLFHLRANRIMPDLVARLLDWISSGLLAVQK